MLAERLTLFACAIAVGFGLNANGVAGEAYPKRAIKLIIPFSAGGSSDFVLRPLADRLATRFGQPIIIDNRPGGAGGTVGTAIVARAEPDGYTLLASSPGPLVTAGALYTDLGYDPDKSFSPVSQLFNSPQLLAIAPDVPAKSIGDLVAYARNNPRKLSFASPGYGTQPHLLGEMFKAAAGIDVVHVPYKGPSQALTDVLAGRVQMYFETSPLILPQAKAGRLKILAVAGDSRSAQLPAIPTMAENGFPGVTGGFWFGILAPAKTPESVINRLNGAINETMRTDEMRVALTKLGAQATLGSPQQFADFIATERRKWSEVIRIAGIKME